MLFGGDVARVVEVRITGSMGTLVLVVTFKFPALVRLVVREVLIRMVLLLPRLGLDEFYPLFAGFKYATKVRFCIPLLRRTGAGPGWTLRLSSTRPYDGFRRLVVRAWRLSFVLGVR